MSYSLFFALHEMKKDKPQINQEKDHVFDEFLNDVENDIKMEKYKLLWKKYGKLFSSAATVCIAIAVFVTLWTKNEESRRKDFAKQFVSAQAAAEDDKLDIAAAIMSFLSSKKLGGYSVLAKMSNAGVLAKKDFKKNSEEIKKIYKSVFEDKKSPVYIKDLAKVLYVNTFLEWLGSAEISEEDANEMLGLLKTCKGEDGFHLLAKEFEAMVYYKMRKFGEARHACDEISKNRKTSYGLRMRASIMIQAIQNQLESVAINDNEEDFSAEVDLKTKTKKGKQ
jgi:hypothetical protein